MVGECININAEQRVIESKPRMLLGILGDKDSERVWFKSDKIIGDGVDLSRLQLYIKYAACDKRARKYIKETQIYHCEDVQDCGDYITFSWLMSGNVFSESGFVAYSILAANGSEVRWNTYPAVGTVGMTVPGGLEEVAEEYQDVITQLFERLESLEEAGIPEELVKKTVTEYLEEHPVDVPVSSVNGKTGSVKVTAEDVGALPDTTQIPTRLSELQNDKGYLTEHQDISHLAPKATTLEGYGITDGAKKTDIPKAASDIGAEPAGTAKGKVDEHNVSGTAHDDIRGLIKKLEPKIPSLLSDLTDDTGHRTVSDAEKEKWNNKSDFSGSYNDLRDKPEVSKSQNFFVNFSEDVSGNMIADKTFSQIIEACDAGLNIFAILEADGEKVIVPLVALVCTGEYQSDDYDTIIFSKTCEGAEFSVIGISNGSNDVWAQENTDTVPAALPNPHKLTFEGAVQAEYDGSGAVKVNIPNGQATARVEKDAADTDVTIEPNKLYIFPEMTMLNITLADIQDASIANEYHFVFKSGVTATTFTLPDSIKTPDSFKVDTNKIYEISIMEECMAYQSWAVS